MNISNATHDRRKRSPFRAVIGLILGKDGEVSGSKISTYIAQYISAKLLLTAPALPTWDALAVLFLVLIAPEAYKQMMAMKWGGSGSFTERTESSSSTRTVDAPKGKK